MNGWKSWFKNCLQIETEKLAACLAPHKCGDVSDQKNVHLGVGYWQLECLKRRSMYCLSLVLGITLVRPGKSYKRFYLRLLKTANSNLSCL